MTTTTTALDLDAIRAHDYRPDRNGAAAYRQSDLAAQDVPMLIAEVERMQAAAKDWHDTYQQHAGAVDEFFGDLLKLLPGAENEGMDAYDQIPRGIEKLRAEVKREQERCNEIGSWLDDTKAKRDELLAEVERLREENARLRQQAAASKVSESILQGNINALVAERDA